MDICSGISSDIDAANTCDLGSVINPTGQVLAEEKDHNVFPRLVSDERVSGPRGLHFDRQPAFPSTVTRSLESVVSWQLLTDLDVFMSGLVKVDRHGARVASSEESRRHLNHLQSIFRKYSLQLIGLNGQPIDFDIANHLNTIGLRSARSDVSDDPDYQPSSDRRLNLSRVATSAPGLADIEMTRTIDNPPITSYTGQTAQVGTEGRLCSSNSGGTQHTMAAIPNQKQAQFRTRSIAQKQPVLQKQGLKQNQESIPIPAKKNVSANPGPKLSLYAVRFYANLAGLDASHLAQLQEDLAIDKLPSFDCGGVVQNNGAAGTNECRVIASGISSCLNFLNSMERAQGVAMARTNCVYWLLGMAFERYESAIGLSRQPRKSSFSHPSRTQAHLVLSSLMKEQYIIDELKGQDGTVAHARKRAFIQQLQRARKYVLLTKTFPESILLAVPYVCVSRLDKITMHELDLAIEPSEGSFASDATDEARAVAILTTDYTTCRNQVAKIISLLRPLQESVRNGLDRMMQSRD